MSLIYRVEGWAKLKDISLRAGVHAGDVELITDINNKTNISGDTINYAQRVMDAANPKQVLFSDVAFRQYIGSNNPSYSGSPYGPECKAVFEGAFEVRAKHGMRMLVYKMTLEPPQEWLSNDDPVSNVAMRFGEVPPQVTCWSGRPASLGTGFVGREEDMTELTSTFAGKKALVISGGPGCGKSRLAAEFTHRLKGNGFWTAGGNTAALTLAALAPALGIAMAGKTDNDIATEAQNRLVSLPQGILWVIDNLPDIDQLNALLNLGSPVRIIATTRDSSSNLLSPLAGFKGLGVLNDKAAGEMLCSRYRSHIDPGNPLVAKIIEKVGCLPLALERLAVWLAEERRTLETVLAQLNQAPNPLQLKVFQEAGGMTIPRGDGVFATLTGSLKALPEHIRQSLSYLGYIADAPVSGALVLALTGLSDEKLTELLSVCNRRTTLAWVDGHVVIHSLNVAAIAATNPDGALKVVLERALSRLNEINTADPAALRAELVHYERLLAKVTKEFGGEDIWVLALANSLAIGYRSAGRNDDAIKLDEETLKIMERVLGKEHPDTLKTRNNLAVGYRSAGRNDEAIKLDEETLKIMERVLGKEHPSTLSSRNNLANGYYSAGRNDEAIKLYEETLKIRERVLGKEHPSTLNSRNNLAISYRAAGRDKDADRLEANH